MIQVSLTSLLLLSMIIGVGVLGLSWLFAVIKQRHYEQRAREDLVSCRICGNIYENEQKQSLTACPRCGSLNEAMKPKPI